QLRRNGRGSYGGGPVRFDLARNWLLMEALLSAPELTVQHVFVNRALRASLLRHGRRSGASAELLERAARVILPPLGSSHPHLNHFHVRIYCPADDIGAADGVPGCRDRGPFFPWLPVDHPFAPASAHPSRAP
ncbi:MAG: hypothetical protein OEY14_04095, partial [Myxococcales bacterium]|nr:hypothetical protein [Myxococcales bacterium]